MAQSVDIISMVKTAAPNLPFLELNALARFLDEICKERQQAELKTPGLNEAQVCPSESGCTDACSPDSGGTVAPYPYSGRADVSRLDSDDEYFGAVLEILANLQSTDSPNSSSSAVEEGNPPTQSPHGTTLDIVAALDVSPSTDSPNSSSSAVEDGYPPTQSPLQSQPSGKEEEEVELYVDPAEVMFRYSKLYFPDIVKPSAKGPKASEEEKVMYKEGKAMYEEAVQARIDELLGNEGYDTINDDMKRTGKWFMDHDRAPLCHLRYRRGGKHRCPLSNLPTDESEDLAGYIPTREKFLSRVLVKWEFVRELLDKVNPSAEKSQFKKCTSEVNKGHCVLEMKIERKSPSTKSGKNTRGTKRPGGGSDGDNNNNGSGTPPEPSRGPDGSTDATGGTSSSGSNDTSSNKRQKQRPMGVHGSEDVQGALEEDVDDSEANSDDNADGINDDDSDVEEDEDADGINDDRLEAAASPAITPRSEIRAEIPTALQLLIGVHGSEEDVDNSEAHSNDNDDDAEDDYEEDEDADGVNDDRLEAAASPAIAPHSEIRAENPMAGQLFPATPTKQRAYEDRPSKAEKMQANDVDETRSVFTETIEEVPFQHTNIRAERAEAELEALRRDKNESAIRADAELTTLRRAVVAGMKRAERADAELEELRTAVAVGALRAQRAEAELEVLRRDVAAGTASKKAWATGESAMRAVGAEAELEALRRDVAAGTASKKAWATGESAMRLFKLA